MYRDRRFAQFRWSGAGGGHDLCSDGSFKGQIVPAAGAGPAQLPGTVISSCWCVAEHKIVISLLVTIIRYSSLLHEGNTIIPLVTVMK
jgi:hypothetical protein